MVKYQLVMYGRNEFKSPLGTTLFNIPISNCTEENFMNTYSIYLFAYFTILIKCNIKVFFSLELIYMYLFIYYIWQLLI